MRTEQDEYVSANEGVELLGVKRNKFFYHVEKGEIGVQPGETARRNRYKKQDILVLKERLRAQRLARIKPVAPPLIIDWIMPADIPAALKMLQQVYNEEIDLAEAAIYQSWRKNNNKLSMGAFSTDRQECYGSIQVVPLDEQVILDILSGKRRESSIEPDEVRSYDEPGPYTLLATNAAVLLGRPSLLYQILSHYMQFWIDQFPERYITRVYAQAVSESGDQMIGHFFMSPRYDLADNAFVLDLARPGTSRIIRQFKERLKAKAPLPDELLHPYPPQPARDTSQKLYRFKVDRDEAESPSQ
jgi:hypothetical protein